LSMGSHSVICHPTEVTAPPNVTARILTEVYDQVKEWCVDNSCISTMCGTSGTVTDIITGQQWASSAAYI